MPLRDNQTSENNIFSVALLVLAFYQYVKDRCLFCGEYRIRTDDPLLAGQVL